MQETSWTTKIGTELSFFFSSLSLFTFFFFGGFNSKATMRECLQGARHEYLTKVMYARDRCRRGGSVGGKMEREGEGEGVGGKVKGRGMMRGGGGR